MHNLASTSPPPKAKTNKHNIRCGSWGERGEIPTMKRDEINLKRDEIHLAKRMRSTQKRVRSTPEKDEINLRRKESDILS